MPTSWFNYQTLLFVPVGWLFLRLPFERSALAPWTVLAISSLPLLTMDGNLVTPDTEAWVAASRALASVGVWISVLLWARLDPAWGEHAAHPVTSSGL
jgi:hypothetical protein